MINKFVSEWNYNNKPFDSDMIGDYVGFVYEVYDTETEMKYIGKKKFWSRVTRPPLKGIKNKRILLIFLSFSISSILIL